MAQLVDPARCPLCGEPSRCAMACSKGACDSDPGAGTCWCFRVTIPQALLDRIPAPARGVACICARCVERARDPAVSG